VEGGGTKLTAIAFINPENSRFKKHRYKFTSRTKCRLKPIVLLKFGRQVKLEMMRLQR